MIFQQEATARNYENEPHWLLELMERKWLECRRRQLEMAGSIEQSHKYVLLVCHVSDMRSR